MRIASLLEDPLDVTLARSIFGTEDAGAIAARVERYCRERLGAEVAGCELFSQSVGAVFVLTLAGGARVVLKVHGSNQTRLGTTWSPAALRAVYGVQAALAQGGFPCADVLHPPVDWENGMVAAMTYLDGSEAEDPHHPAVRRLMAEVVAELVRRLEPLRDTPDLPASRRPTDAVLWKPHNALFTMDWPGGGWIDDRAREARAVLDADIPPPTLVHTDISGANVRVRDGRVRAVYDMDSVALGDELSVLASIAVHYSCTGDPGGSWPSREEAAAFVADYERVRARPFSGAERERLDAGAIYAMAYTARLRIPTSPEVDVDAEPPPDEMAERLRSAPTRGFFSP
jgi:Ser/Thr protein kinase RdoA (MazF antagonist)